MLMFLNTALRCSCNSMVPNLLTVSIVGNLCFCCHDTVSVRKRSQAISTHTLKPILMFVMIQATGLKVWDGTKQSGLVHSFLPPCVVGCLERFSIRSISYRLTLIGSHFFEVD